MLAALLKAAIVAESSNEIVNRMMGSGKGCDAVRERWSKEKDEGISGLSAFCPIWMPFCLRFCLVFKEFAAPYESEKT